MSSDDSPRHTAAKNAARDLAERTGMPYSAALAHVRAARGRRPRARWLLGEEVTAWFAGVGWRGVGYRDLFDWLDERVRPDYECDWCGQPGDAVRWIRHWSWW